MRAELRRGLPTSPAAAPASKSTQAGWPCRLLARATIAHPRRRGESTGDTCHPHSLPTRWTEPRNDSGIHSVNTRYWLSATRTASPNEWSASRSWPS